MKESLHLIEPNILTIGVDASAPLPLHSDPDAPEFRGFEVDLTKAIAARLGLSVRYKGALWSDIMSDLQARKIDMICTAATITEGRKMTVDFGLPYLDTQLAIVVKDGSGMKRLKDFEGANVGVRISTSAEEFLRGQLKAALIRTFQMNTEAYAALAAGEVDAVVDDAPIAKSFARSVHGLEFAESIPGTEAQYGMVFRKGNDALREAVNLALAEILADATYAESCRKWFGE